MRTFRVIPVMQLTGERLVKTRGFRRPAYIGDPLNAIRIFNEKGVDELIIVNLTLDRSARPSPDFQFLEQLSSEAFMPLAYGGGVQDVRTAVALAELGFEKICVGTAALRRPELVKELSYSLGSQSTVVSLDVRRPRLFGHAACYVNGGRDRTEYSPVEAAQYMEAQGAGELIVTAIGRDGSWSGYDTDLIESIAKAVNIPVVAMGGCRWVDDLLAARSAGAAAGAAGSAFVFSSAGGGVLIRYPQEHELECLTSRDNT